MAIAQRHAIVLALSFLSNFALAQGKIEGRVFNKNNQPLSFVSVVVLQDSNMISGITTNEQGNFQISCPCKLDSAYIIKFSLIGYETVYIKFLYPEVKNLSNIVLIEDKNILKEVIVTAKMPLITRKTDRYIINVENSMLSTAHSALDVLRKSPGIWIDNNGGIRIKGDQPVTVIINEVVQRMPGDELAEYLKTLKSEDISKIEVIHNPPSEFEAAGTGGIIHIILKKEKTNGLNGSVNGQYIQQQNKPLATAGNSLNYKMKNVYLFQAFSFAKDLRSIVEKASIIYPGKSYYSGFSDRDENINNHRYRLGVVYDLAKNQSIVLQTNQTRTRFLQSFITDENYKRDTQLITGIAKANRTRTFKYGSTTINYLYKIDTIGSIIKLAGEYSYTNRKELNGFAEVYNDPFENSTYKTNAPFTTGIHSLQSDMTKILRNKSEIKAGAKYVSIKRDNTIITEDYKSNNWIFNPGKSDHFIYKESILMFYSSVEKSIKRINIKAGLRAEETFSKGNSVSSGQIFSKKYFGLFPSLFIMKILNKENGSAVYVNYSRRLSRPTLSDLNPFSFQYNNYTILTGNPNLLPQFTHNIALGYKFWDDFSADIYLAKTVNVITLSANAKNNFIDYRTENVDKSMQFGLNINTPFTIANVWSINNNFSLYNLAYHFDNSSTNQTSFSIKSVHTIVLKSIVDIDAVVDYRSAHFYANLKTFYVFYFDMGFSKKILKNHGRLRLSFSDLFNTLREKELTVSNNTRIDFYRKRPSQTVGLGFSYNFSSGKKFTQKNIEQTNSEERNRVGN